MDEQTVKNLEERLTRLEAAQAAAARPGFTAPGGAVVDPAPWGGGQIVDPAPWGGNPVVDPAPYPWRPYPWRYPVPRPVADPAPFPPGGPVIRQPPVVGPIGDPAPIDVSRLSAAQLQATLHNINAERARLDGLEEMVNKQLEQLDQG